MIIITKSFNLFWVFNHVFVCACVVKLCNQIGQQEVTLQGTCSFLVCHPTCQNTKQAPTMLVDCGNRREIQKRETNRTREEKGGRRCSHKSNERIGKRQKCCVSSNEGEIRWRAQHRHETSKKNMKLVIERSAARIPLHRGDHHTTTNNNIIVIWARPSVRDIWQRGILTAHFKTQQRDNNLRGEADVVDDAVRITGRDSVGNGQCQQTH